MNSKIHLTEHHRLITIIIVALLTVACAAKDPYTFETTEADKDTVIVPDGCEFLYDRDVKVIAVTEFTNNTSYQDTQFDRTSSRSGASIGILGANTYSSYDSVSKYVTPQLGEFAQNTVESVIVSLGGATVVSRSKLEDILKEQQFQMTLADPDTVVDFGMLLGAQYIITGSVDNINATYSAPVDTNYNTSSLVGTLLTLGTSIYNVAATGWTVSTTMTVNIIDVSTGKIIASHQSTGKTNIGDSPVFTMDQVVAGAKEAMKKSMYKTVAFLNEQFEFKAYVNELRGSKKLARISMGSIEGISKDDEFQMLEIVVQKDFRTGNTLCTLTPTNIELTVTEFVTGDSAWAKISGDKERIKVGSLLKRTKAKR